MDIPEIAGRFTAAEAAQSVFNRIRMRRNGWYDLPFNN
jgi:hypothetical protein